MYKYQNTKEEKERKTKLITVVLIGLLLSGIGLTAYYFIDAQEKAEQLQTETLQALMLNSTLQQIRNTAPNSSFTLKYSSLEAKNITENIITYLTGYIEIKDFQDLYYPADMHLTFNVQHSNSGTAQVTYGEVTTTKTIQLVKGINKVELPFGIYPIKIVNAMPGETILFHVTVTASVYWNPVNVKIAEETTTGLMKINFMPELAFPTPTPTYNPSPTPTSSPTPTPSPTPTVTPTPEPTEDTTE